MFDALGKEVISILNDYKSKGRYEIVFDGSKLVSGIYFYKISINDFTEIKSMTLVK